MKSLINTILLGIILSLVNNGYSQSKDICKQGNDKLMDTIPSKIDSYPSGSSETSVYTPSDPNEIIGTRGYDALGDTLQWVAATASLPYTIYFENDPELATAAAQKVEIHYAYYSIMN